MLLLLYALILAYSVLPSIQAHTKNHSFTIDYEHDTFLMDGKPFRYISGSIHYFRVQRSSWSDRLQKIRALGFNAIQTYVPWNFHEVSEKQYVFTFQRDLEHFISLAKKHELYVLLRVGPYICAEWENGGLPWWLLKKKDIKMRTSDPNFLAAVKNWFNQLLPKLKGLLYQNGGPIIMVQIENEYGSFAACDMNYNIWLRDLVRSHLGSDIVLYTTDGGDEYFLRCGPIPEVYTTVDFGPGTPDAIDKAFAAQRNHTKGHRGPLVNSEFYDGWFSAWGYGNAAPKIDDIIASAQYMYNKGANINFYLIHGGTNFEFWNGAEDFGPVTTSYEFSAPILENGDISNNYIRIHNWVNSLSDWKQRPLAVPKNSSTKAYGQFQLTPVYTWKPKYCKKSTDPLTFEEMNHPMGFMSYSTIVKQNGTLDIPTFEDWAYIYVNDVQIKGLSRHTNESHKVELPSNFSYPAELKILVENEGRRTYETINNPKGILGPVLYNSGKLDDWTTCSLKMGRSFKNNLKNSFNKILKNVKGMYGGRFYVDVVADTFLNLSGWGKGVVIVNTHNIGRYWEIGPQYALYVPASLLKKGYNHVFVLDLLKSNKDCNNADECVISSIDHSIWKWPDRAFPDDSRLWP